MTESLQVVADGVAPDPSPPPPRPSWLVGLIGFVVGLGLGVVVVQPDSEPATEQDLVTVPAQAQEATDTTVEVDPRSQGVAESIPGFSDTLVAVARNSGSSLDHVLWPLEGEVIVRSMTGGSGVELDAWAQFIALAEEIPGAEGGVLRMGRFSTMRPIATDALSYSWHDSEIGHLAYTAHDGEETTLYTVKPDLGSVTVARIPAPGASVVGWGSWGFAIQQDPGTVVLLNPTGELRDTESGRALATHPNGWVLATEDGEVKLISGGGGVRRISAVLDVGTIATAAFSPDMSTVAIAGTTAVAVLDLETEDVVAEADVLTSSLAWSSDSRFVLLPTPSGVGVIDLEDPTRSHAVLRRQWILAVGVVPLDSS